MGLSRREPGRRRLEREHGGTGLTVTTYTRRRRFQLDKHLASVGPASPPVTSPATPPARLRLYSGLNLRADRGLLAFCSDGGARSSRRSGDNLTEAQKCHLGPSRPPATSCRAEMGQILPKWHLLPRQLKPVDLLGLVRTRTVSGCPPLLIRASRRGRSMEAESHVRSFAWFRVAAADFPR